MCVLILTSYNITSGAKLMCNTYSFFCTVLVSFLKMKFHLFKLLPWHFLNYLFTMGAESRNFLDGYKHLSLEIKCI